MLGARGGEGRREERAWEFMVSTNTPTFVYLGGGVDSGSCMEELPHHIWVAIGRRNDQCSVLTLYKVEGALSYMGGKSWTDVVTKQPHWS